LTAQGPNSTDYSQQVSALEDKISQALGGSIAFAILDFPNYPNVGDSAIFLGQLVLLRRLTQQEPSSVSTFRTFHGDPGFEPGSGTVFIQGGGNLGDLWENHQAFREQLLQSLSDTKIVQLPQSIHFETQDCIDQFARAIDQHPDFTLLLRDEPSMELAQAKFDCECHLCPDGAIALGKLERREDPVHPVLCMIRDDHESKMSQSFERFGPVSDWTKDSPNMKSAPDKYFEKAARLAAPRRTAGKLADIYKAWAQARLERGVKQLSEAERVVTDRLHVHILCNLLGIPHVVMDNSYGKISRYINVWGVGKYGVHVSGPDQIESGLAQLSKRSMT
jgi:pyruvyl transferase EpsO